MVYQDLFYLNKYSLQKDRSEKGKNLIYLFLGELVNDNLTNKYVH